MHRDENRKLKFRQHSKSLNCRYDGVHTTQKRTEKTNLHGILNVDRKWRGSVTSASGYWPRSRRSFLSCFWLSHLDASTHFWVVGCRLILLLVIAYSEVVGCLICLTCDCALRCVASKKGSFVPVFWNLLHGCVVKVIRNFNVGWY